MTIEVDVAIIGAGVIGLAIAEKATSQGRSVFVFEKNGSFGQETSSRNSEVIHAGIYYPQDSLKAKLCVKGNRLLYDLCEKHNIPHRRIGKLIVASEQNEIPLLEDLHKQAMLNGVADLTPLSREDISQLEPSVRAVAGLLSPSTGIIDSHKLMELFYNAAKRNGAEFLFETEVIGLSQHGSTWIVDIRDWEGVTSISSHVTVNTAGLYADRIAQLAGLDIARQQYRLHYCKGSYFSLSSPWTNRVNRLVYPVPEKVGLGIHITPGLDGRIRLGPDSQFVSTIDYKVDSSRQIDFFHAVKRFLPELEESDLQPEFAGIRPKLQGPDETFRDFIISHEGPLGFPGLINLIGIESPGLTAAPAIAEHVSSLISTILN